MSKYSLCPPGYNGGFCADYADCKECWEGYSEEIGIANVETSKTTSNDLLAKIVEIARKGYLIYFDGSDSESILEFFRIKLVDYRTQKIFSRAIFLEKPTDFSIDSLTLEVIEMLDAMVKIFEEEKDESKG